MKPKADDAQARLPAGLPLRPIYPDTVDEDWEQMDIESDLAELGDLLTPERFAAELEMCQMLYKGIAQVLKLIAQVKNMKKTLRSAASIPRVRLVIDKSTHPTWGRSSNWGNVSLITNKRRR